MDPQGAGIKNPTPLTLRESHGLFCTSLSRNTQTGPQPSWINTSHMGLGDGFGSQSASRLSQGVSCKLHLREGSAVEAVKWGDEWVTEHRRGSTPGAHICGPVSGTSGTDLRQALCVQSLI